LLFWKNNAFKYPILSILARRYLAIPATSASIERIVSVTSNIISKNRINLYPNTVKEIILLKNWKIKDLKELELLYKEEDIEDNEE
ncbi:hypothetical protein ACRALDRAFT_1026449, partial [Sodiomyces alcalophilus JCM 7366]|uniref:uncharacterized protein n=1 Tax=Sodiomyces alcalophilus JCM 7366 TaxID=591952 RepID=UPI0039B5A7C5